MQEEFTDYIRKQTRSYALVLVPVILGIAVLALIASQMDEEESRKQEMLLISFLLGAPALVVAVLLALS